jgi:Flp pilus assembly protein TadG
MDQHPGLKRSRQRGDAIVEFAILAPSLMLILFGMLELGRVVDAWLVVHNAAREGARAGALDYQNTATTASNAAYAYLVSGFAPRRDIAAMSVPNVQVSTDTVQVTAAADVQVFTPWFQSLLGGTGSAHVQMTAAMRRQ